MHFWTHDGLYYKSNLLEDVYAQFCIYTQFLQIGLYSVF